MPPRGQSPAELCPAVTWYTQLVTRRTGPLAEETSKRSVECTAWFLLDAYCKMQEEKEKLREELCIKKMIWEILSLSRLQNTLN